MPQTLHAHATATTLQGAQQTIARGPVASQIAIKQLGTNGGGFYNSNSAVPFENPTGLSNFLEMLAILLIPAAQVFMFGRMVLARRHAWAVFAAMFVDLRDRYRREPSGGAARLGGAAQLRREHHAGARLERRQHGRQGGSLRPGATRALWAVATSDASNGSVNGGFDAMTPAGGAVPLVNLFLGEVIFGGVGSGLYGMFFYIIIAVFVAGLMVGRTPEWLGKKIEAREIKYAALGALFVPTMVLTLAALSIVTKSGLASIYNSGVHGFTETLYAYDSQGEQQRQRFRRLRADQLQRRLRGDRDAARPLRPDPVALALAGALAKKKIVPAIGRHVPHRRRHIRRPARRRDRAHRRADDLPGPDPRSDRRRIDALMRNVLSSVIAIVVITVFFGFGYPLVMTGFAQVAFKSQAKAA